MIPYNQAKLSSRWVWTAAVGLALFLLIQVFPTSYTMFKSDNHDVLTRSQAENLAIGIAERQFGIPGSDIGVTSVTHLSDSDAVGYYAKNHLLSDHTKQWGKVMPTDYYRVDLHLREQSGTLLLLLHLETGKLVGWRHQAANAPASELQGDGDHQTAAKALRYAQAWGIDSAGWEWSGMPEKDGSMLFFSTKPALGEAKPWLKIRMPVSYSETSSSAVPWEGGYLIYGTQLPLDYLAYMDNQESLASKFSTFGYIVPQLLMLVCAIVAAGVYAAYSSFTRGIFLAGLFVGLYIVFTYNMIPGLRASVIGISTSARDTLSQDVVTVSIIIYAAMGLLTYLSAVGGDGVWNKMGYKLWPRWREADYGDSVLRSMKTGYFLAFILLGVQSVILIALEQSIGAFAASDPSQSMYNMTYPWLLPILAWCAGISEEMQSRFFGIGLFRRWLVGGASKLLGREPSARTASWLTFAAMLPPGMLWAFGHVGYAVYPVYTRLIELVLLSLLFGWFMLRFGLMAVIFAHVTLDGILMGLQMITDGLPGDYWGGLFSLLMPGLAGIVIWRLHRYAARSRGTA